MYDHLVEHDHVLDVDDPLEDLVEVQQGEGQSSAECGLHADILGGHLGDDAAYLCSELICTGSGLGGGLLVLPGVVVGGGGGRDKVSEKTHGVGL